MEQEDGLIVIDPKALVLARDDAGQIVVTPEAKDQLQKILRAHRLVEEVLSYVKDKLAGVMEENGLSRIVAGNIVIGKRPYGDKYKISDRSQVPEQFTKVVSWTKANSETIEEFYHKENTLPPGIVINPRSDQITIKEKEPVPE